MPTISIIIPVYNAKKTLEQCLQSIFQQSFRNFEIITVNDGSTDGSEKILEKYKNQITVVSQPNRGAAAARNTGAGLAKGRYLIFIDADATLKPNMLKIMYDTLEKNQTAAYAYSSFAFGRKIFKLWPWSASRLRTMPYIHTTSLIRKDLFPGFDKKLKRFQDWDLWLTMLKHGHHGKFIPQILFTIESGGTMSTWLPKVAYKIPFLKSVKKYRQAEQLIKKKHNL